MIGSLIPQDDPYWNNFCTFLRIAQHLFAPQLTANDLGVLQEKIMTHQQKFIAL
jgi:hypothetical protein